MGDKVWVRAYSHCRSQAYSTDVANANQVSEPLPQSFSSSSYISRFLATYCAPTFNPLPACIRDIVHACYALASITAQGSVIVSAISRAPNDDGVIFAAGAGAWAGTTAPTFVAMAIKSGHTHLGATLGSAIALTDTPQNPTTSTAGSALHPRLEAVTEGVSPLHPEKTRDLSRMSIRTSRLQHSLLYTLKPPRSAERLD